MESKNNEIGQIKRKILNAIKDLERADYIDICVYIKSHVNDISMINETPRGTFIDLDRLEPELIIELGHIISTKLQRISER